MSIEQNIIKNKIKKHLELFIDKLDSVEIVLRNKVNVSSNKFRNNEGVNNIVKEINNYDSPTIYRFSIGSKKERDELINAYNQNKEQCKQKGICISKNNGMDSETLYVGSKLTDLKSRLKQHLSGISKSTYGLHLNQWDDNVDYNLTIEVYEVNYDIDGSYNLSFLELIEQGIWEEYKPMFGKKSGH